MLHLDPRSIISVAGLTCTVMAMLLWSVRRTLPIAMSGISAWATAPLLCALSSIIFGLENLLPPFVILLTGNALLLFGMHLFYFGSLRFLQRPCPWRTWAAASLALLAVMSIFWWVEPDFRIRTILFAGSLALCTLIHALLLYRHGKGFASRFMALVLILLCGILALRASTTYWLDLPTTSRLAQTPHAALYAVSFHLAALLLSIGCLLAISERVRYEFEHQASHDSLTGALTRRSLFQACQQEWANWKRHANPFSVLLIDIDHFKSINDHWGHPTGDKVLQDCTARISALLRSMDLLGRYGGEEFIALLPATDSAAALSIAQRIREGLNSQATPDMPAYTASIGVATASAADADFDTLLKRADLGLYQAKAAGRNQAVAWSV